MGAGICPPVLPTPSRLGQKGPIFPQPNINQHILQSHTLMQAPKLFDASVFALCFSACGSGSKSTTPSQQPSMSSSLAPNSSAAAISSTAAVSSAAPTSVASSSAAPLVATPLKSLTDRLGFKIGVEVGGPGDGDDFFAPENLGIAPLVNSHFNSLVAQNIMKMRYLHPKENEFTWENAETLAHFARDNGHELHGHALLWHNEYQLPDFIKNFSGPPLQFETLLHQHVTNITDHFKGTVASWDVVNEAISDDTPATWRPSKLHAFSGNSPIYIEKAFLAARAADPNVLLYYNDYNLEGVATKRQFMLAMVDDFKKRAIFLDGIGLQMHITLDWPSTQELETTFAEIVKRGLKVRLSEVDIAVNTTPPYKNQLDGKTAEAQKQRYKNIVHIYLKTVPKHLRGGITFWGTVDDKT